MKTNCLCILAAAAWALAGTLPVQAGPLVRSDMPAEPSWVLHVDCDQLRNTAIGQFLLAEMNKPEVQAKFAAFETIFSFDPRTALRGLTLYSTGTAPEDGVLLVYADINASRLETLVKAAKDYQSTPYKQHVIHNWIDEKKKKGPDGSQPRVYAAIHGGRVVIFGQRQARVAGALDVLDKAAPSLGVSAAFPQLGASDNASFIQGLARKVDLPPSDPNAALFRLTRQTLLQVSEAQRQLNATLTLDARDEEVAAQMVTVAQGLVALMKLQTDKPESVKLAEATTIRQEGASVVGRLNLSVDEVVAMLKAGAARAAAQKASEP